jgi:pSer/pThr/pTyr-binding forkhead associated (FHA) protein
MSSDPNKKSARQFQCRDVLWETFEQMARELECSVDYLINEAMKQYARQRSMGARTPYATSGQNAGLPGRPDSPSMPGSFPPGPPHGAAPSPGAPSARGGLPPPPARGPAGGLREGSMSSPMTRTGASAAPPRSLNVPTPPPRGAIGLTPPPRGGVAPRTAPPPLPSSSKSGPPPLGGGNGLAMPMPAGAQLTVIYQGERVPVSKEKFVIGRGKQSSDLTLKDPNVSRQHAMIEYQNGVYFMVDMGSTNGVEYNGQRIARKQIAEGDVFRICDHDLLFTYR